MNVNHLDARAITQPGGMYAGINDALLATVSGYFQGRDREAQAERQLRRDERAGRREQYRAALADARDLGVVPRQDDAGWLAPGDQAGIDAALMERARKLAQAAEDRKRTAALAALNEKRLRLELALAGVEPELRDTDLLGETEPDATLAAAFAHGQERRDLELARMRKALEDKPAGTTATMAEWAFGRDGDNKPILFNRRTGETRPVSGAPSQPIAPPALPVAPPPEAGPGFLSRQVQRMQDYYSGPTLTPRWSDPGAGLTTPPTPAPLPPPSLPVQSAPTSTLAPAPAVRSLGLDQIRSLLPEARRAYLRDLAQRDPATFQAMRQHIAGGR